MESTPKQNPNAVVGFKTDGSEVLDQTQYEAVKAKLTEAGVDFTEESRTIEWGRPDASDTEVRDIVVEGHVRRYAVSILDFVDVAPEAHVVVYNPETKAEAADAQVEVDEALVGDFFTAEDELMLRGIDQHASKEGQGFLIQSDIDKREVLTARKALQGLINIESSALAQKLEDAFGVTPEDLLEGNEATGDLSNFWSRMAERLKELAGELVAKIVDSGKVDDKEAYNHFKDNRLIVPLINTMNSEFGTAMDYCHTSGDRTTSAEAALDKVIAIERYTYS